MLREEVAIDPVYRERFRREGEMLAALNHAHIIPIYGMGEVDGELYIASRLGPRRCAARSTPARSRWTSR